ncbi:MAG: AAA family ATPase [Desulfuromonadales bacterium GWD2_61_12]|nr:MAG: AAA family ATPase [Desulfuromonadales bacterium GWC2_61_20]OGR32473.1 MAG: AAA family ATPase [Desulfuromonadales bacterium GWD2_61_12]HAD04519.1 AAA family ATPase [Desulfuromonas sp.]HBT82245.1 AAA family ATPase [Desulfuromonas sp.]
MNPLAFFELEREPFSNAPDARFYFNSEQHTQALTRLLYSVDSNKGLAVLVGGVGTGKTTLARRMLDSLPEERYESSLLVMVHSSITPEWIMTRISMQLGVEVPSTDRLQLLRQLYERLLQIDAAGRRAVVLIDEAQMLKTRELMEEFRGLLNLEIPGKKLLNIIFFGLPEVEECLKLDEPLAQRVAVKYHLRSLTPALTESYIKHRLQIAGAKRMLFRADTVTAIHGYAGGVPRLINTICDNCLFEAAMRKAQDVDLKIVQSVVGDLGLLRQALPADAAPAAIVVNNELDDIENMLDRLEQKA